MSLVVNKSVIPMKLILQYDWMLQFTLFYIISLDDKLFVNLLMLSKDFRILSMLNSVLSVPRLIFHFSTYINRLLTFLYTTYIRTYIVCSSILLSLLFHFMFYSKWISYKGWVFGKLSSFASRWNRGKRLQQSVVVLAFK